MIQFINFKYPFRDNNKHVILDRDSLSEISLLAHQAVDDVQNFAFWDTENLSLCEINERSVFQGVRQLSMCCSNHSGIRREIVASQHLINLIPEGFLYEPNLVKDATIKGSGANEFGVCDDDIELATDHLIRIYPDFSANIGSSSPPKEINIGNTMVALSDNDISRDLVTAIPIINTLFTIHNPSKGNLGLYYFNEVKKLYSISDDISKKITEALTPKEPTEQERIQESDEDKVYKNQMEIATAIIKDMDEYRKSKAK